MINYSWEFPEDAFEVFLEENGLINVVKFIKWIRIAEEVDGENTYTATNSATFICPEPNPQDYTPYDQLTADQVYAWLESGLQMSEIDSALKNDIEQQKAPKTVVLPNPFHSGSLQ